MIRVEQIRLLEERVLGVVERLNELRAENKTLRDQLATYQDRIEDLEAWVRTYSDSQAEIEQGILNALQKLDDLEDEVTDSFTTENEVVVEDETDEEPEVDSEPSRETPDEEPAEPESEAETERLDPDEASTDPELEIF